MTLFPALALLTLLMAVGFAFAYNRQRTRMDQLGHDREGYVQVFEQANDAVLVLNFVNGKIQRANQRAATMLGYAPGQLDGKTIFDLHFKEDLDRSARRIADAWGNGGMVYDDIPFRHAQGGTVPVECSTKVTSYDDKPAIVLYARDISERLRLQKEVNEKNAIVEQQNQEMRSGLRYAQGIQAGMLPSLGQLRASFADAFVLFRPRDIVSGDFYWSARVGHRMAVAVADCTGHGVPGALLSMTGIALLQQIVAGRGIVQPAKALEELRTGLLRALVHQEGDGHVRDGMNIGLVVYDTITRECEYSGALCPLYILRAASGELEEVKGDRIPVGFQDGHMRPFTPHVIQLNVGDRMYMASDGYADQFGGPLGKKMKSAGLRDLLRSTASTSVCEQGRIMEKAFAD